MKPPSAARLGAGLHGLGVLATRLAQVRVQVDQAGKRDQAGGVQYLGAGRRAQAGPDLGDETVAEQQVGGRSAERPGALDQPCLAVAGHLATSPVVAVVSVVAMVAAVSVVGVGAVGAAGRRRQEQVQDGHPDADPVRDLLDDGRARRVGDLGRDLDAAVHRTGVHDDGVVGQQRHPAGVQPVPAAVFAHRREVRGIHPLGLHPEHHHDVGLGQRRREVVADLARPGRYGDRQQRGRRDERDVGAERAQQQHVGPGHPAVQDVADDRDAQAVQAAEPAPHGEGVEQRLRGVLVRAVAGIDHAAAHPAGQPVRGARRLVPDHDRVCAHRLQRQRRVLEALALGDARALGGEVDDVGGQPLGGGLERDPRPGRVLVEQVDHCPAAQRRQLPDRPVGELGQLVGRVENQQGVVAAEVGRGDQVAVHFAASMLKMTASWPSVSVSSTCTTSRWDVGRFLPT